MTNLYNRIESLCVQKGIKIAHMCAATGIRSGVMSDLKMGRSKSLSTETLSKIGSFFGVSVDYLLGKEDQKEKAPAKAEADEDPLSQVSFALFGTHDEIDEDILSEVREFARFKLEQKRKAAEEKK